MEINQRKDISVLEEIAKGEREGQVSNVRNLLPSSPPRDQISGTESSQSTEEALWGHPRSHCWSNLVGAAQAPHKPSWEALHLDGHTTQHGGSSGTCNTVSIVEGGACVGVEGLVPRGSHTPVTGGERNQKNPCALVGNMKMFRTWSKKDLQHWSEVSRSKGHKHQLQKLAGCSKGE